MSEPGRSALHASVFDLLSHDYERYFGSLPLHSTVCEWLIGRLSPQSRVLDVGSGTGVPVARRLADAGMRVVGIDASAEMVAAARRNVPEAAFLRMDIGDLRLDGRRFEAAVACSSLLFLRKRELPDALAALRALLVPPGLLVLTMVQGAGDGVEAPVRFADVATGQGFTVPGVSLYVSTYEPSELTRILEACGFAVHEIRADRHHPPLASWTETHFAVLASRRVDGAIRPSPPDGSGGE